MKDIRTLNEVAEQFGINEADDIKEMGAKEFMTSIRDALAKGNMPRIANTSGAAIRGWTNSIGSTGFSVKDKGKDIDIHIVISGKKAGIKYKRIYDRDGSEYDEPANQDSLHPKIKQIINKLGIQVKNIRSSGHSGSFDDDVTYNIIAKRPKWLISKN